MLLGVGKKGERREREGKITKTVSSRYIILRAVKKIAT